MNVPDDLPGILFYKVGVTCRVALPRRPVEYVGSSGKTTAQQVTPRIPLGCTGWKLPSDSFEDPWRAMETLPKAWMPFLQRQRGSEMDPRPEPRQVAADAIRDGEE